MEKIVVPCSTLQKNRIRGNIGVKLKINGFLVLKKEKRKKINDSFAFSIQHNTEVQYIRNNNTLITLIVK